MLRPDLLLVIDPAAADDAPALLDLLAASALPQDGFVDHLDTALVARLDGAIVGCAALEVYADGALLRSVAVDDRFKGGGIGTELTTSALRLAGTLGVPAVYLLTTTAEGFFPRWGFERIARNEAPPGVQTSEEFRTACPASAAVMRKVLPPEAHTSKPT
jgi:amino-acid N-acetyltransferase